MRTVCDDVACLQNMLDFEAALARAEAATGVIPASAAGPIAAACNAGAFDLAALAQAATRSGNLAIPLVKALTADVARTDAEAARYVHWGATSQDVIDTAAMLTLRAGIDALLADTRPRHCGLCHPRAGSIATRPSWRAPGCSMRCRCRSASSSPNMPPRCTARACDCNGCAAKPWCCSSAAPPVPSPRSATRDAGRGTTRAGT